jgi:hypothetical protein
VGGSGRKEKSLGKEFWRWEADLGLHAESLTKFAKFKRKNQSRKKKIKLKIENTVLITMSVITDCQGAVLGHQNGIDFISL